MRNLISVISILALLILANNGSGLAETSNLLEIDKIIGRGPIESPIWGLIDTVEWSPDGEALAIGSTQGIWLYTVTVGNTFQDSSITSGQPLGGIRQLSHPISWNNDNIRLAMANDASDIVIWNTQTQTPIVTLSEHDTFITHLDWSPDGTWLASSSTDAPLVMSDYDGGLDQWQSQELPTNTNGLIDMEWSPNSVYLAASTFDNKIYVFSWDETNTSWNSAEFTNHTNQITAIAWSPDNTRFASVDQDHNLFIWERVNDEWQLTHSYSKPLLEIAWSPDSTQLAGSDIQGEIFIWDIAEDSIIASLPAISGATRQLFWQAPDPEFLHISAWGIHLVDVSQMTILQTTEVFTDSRQNVINGLLRPNHDQFIAYWNNTVYLYDRTTGTLLDTLVAHNGDIHKIEWNPTGTEIGSASYDGWVRTWDVETGNRLVSFNPSLSADTPTIAWNPDWTLLGGFGRGGIGIVIYDWQVISNTRSPIETLPVVTSLGAEGGFLVGATWTTDNSNIVQAAELSSEPPTAFHTEEDNWRFIGELGANWNSPLVVVAHPSQPQVAIGGRNDNLDGLIEVWDLTNTPILIASTTIADREIEDLAWSPDGNTLAGIGIYNTCEVYLWSLTTQTVTTLTVGEEPLRSVSWGVNDWLAVSSAAQIHIYDMSTSPQELTVLESDQSDINGVAWSPNGAMLASADGDDGTIILWKQSSQP